MAHTKITQEDLVNIKVPQKIPVLHSRILKIVIISLNFLPLAIYLIVATVKVQGQTQQAVCVFKYGTQGATPCFVDAKLRFDDYSRTLEMLFGPIIGFEMDWTLVCVEENFLDGEEYGFKDKNLLLKSKVVTVSKTIDILYGYDRKEYIKFERQKPDNCYIEKIANLKHLVAFEFVELLVLGVILGFYVSLYYGHGKQAHTIIILVSFVMNLEVLGFPISVLLHILSHLVLVIYHKITRGENYEKEFRVIRTEEEV